MHNADVESNFLQSAWNALHYYFQHSLVSL